MVDGFTKGFSTGFIGPVPNNTKVHTLCSASQQPTIVREKIEAEIAAGRVLGPFKEPPFSNLVLSPIGLVEKKSPGEYRLIHHLSYPDNKSINDGIPDEAASVQYTTVDDAIAVIRYLGVACFMAKTDIRKAFRLLPIREEHHLLGFAFREHYYVDTCLPMGLKSSCRLFEAFSSALELIARKQLKIPHILHLLDDFLIIADSAGACNAQLDRFLALCNKLGVPMADEKTLSAANVMIFLGIELDTIKFEARLPLDKLEKCMRLIQDVLAKPKITLKKLQQITGTLSFACQVVVPGRAFLRRLINLSIGLSKPFQHVRLNQRANISSLVKLRSKKGPADLANVPNSIQWQGVLQIWYMDSSPLSTLVHRCFRGSGIRSHIRRALVFWQLACTVEDTESIAFLELYPIMASICVWASELSNQRIVIHSDNEALESVINKSTSKHPGIMSLIRRMTLTCMQFNINIRAQHIAGKLNSLADMLSRLQIDQFRKKAHWVDKQPTTLPGHILPESLFPA